MPTSTLAIGLFRDRLEVAHCRRGRIFAAHALPISLGSAVDAEAWAGEVRSLSEPLRSALHELGMDGRKSRAIVVYESPSAVADCYSIPAGSTGEARQAAMLSAADSIPQTAQNLTTGTVFIGRDDGEAPLRNPSGKNQSNHTDSATHRSGRSHVLAAAEREDIIFAISSMLGRANVELLGAVPVPAVIAAIALKLSADHVAQRRRRATSTSAAAPLLHIAESGSFLVIRDTGRSQRGAIRFTRPISIGITALAHALMPSMERRAGSSPDVAAARTALAEFGLPQDPDAQHESTGLTARDVLPSLQPLVQRLVIELRQSLRFALEQSERNRVTLVLTGPGGAIPGLEKALERELGVQVTAGESRMCGAAKTGSFGSELSDAAATYFRRGSYAIDDLFLKPPGAALRQTTVRIKQALWTGAAAALALIVLDTARLHDRIAHERNNDHEIQPAILAGTPQLAALAGRDPIQLLSLLDAAAQFRAEIERETRQSVDIRSCMQELSALTPSAIRFNAVSFQAASGDASDAADSSMALTITGVAHSDEAAQPRTTLDRFVRQLRSSELFSRVELKNVQIAARSADAPGEQHFEILLSAAPSLRSTRAASASAMASPAQTASAASEGVQ